MDCAFVEAFAVLVNIIEQLLRTNLLRIQIVILQRRLQDSHERTCPPVFRFVARPLSLTSTECSSEEEEVMTMLMIMVIDIMSLCMCFVATARREHLSSSVQVSQSSSATNPIIIATAIII